MRAQNCLRHLGIRTQAQARLAYKQNILTPANVKARGLGRKTLQEICAWADIEQEPAAPYFVIKQREWEAMPLQTRKSIRALFGKFWVAVLTEMGS